jgi:hypothetical protein
MAYDPRFDHKRPAALPLTGDEIVLLFQAGIPSNATVNSLRVPAAIAATPSNLSDVIAILRANGFCV